MKKTSYTKSVSAFQEVNQVLHDTSSRVEQFLREQKQFMQSCNINIETASEQLATAKSITELNRFQKEVNQKREKGDQTSEIFE